jgi:hypothetical protein
MRKKERVKEDDGREKNDQSRRLKFPPRKRKNKGRKTRT